MEKMQSVYKENPQLGDPNSLGQSLEQTSIKIAGLVEERDKYQVLCVCVCVCIYIPLRLDDDKCLFICVGMVTRSTRITLCCN